MTSEHVQRLAEWFGVYRTDEPSASKESAMRFAQKALDVSGATARIEELERVREALHEEIQHQGSKRREAEKRVEELEKVLRYVERTSQHTDFGHQIVVRSTGEKQTLIAWISLVLKRAALSQARQSEPS